MKLCSFLAISACLLTWSVAGAQKLPDTPAGHRLGEWLVAFNSATDLQSHIAKSFAPGTLTAAPASMRALFQNARRYETRGYDVRSVERSRPTSISLLAQAKLTQLWYRLELEVESEPPHLITRYDAPRIPAPTSGRREGTDANVVRELKSLLHQMSKADAFSGAVLLARGDSILFRGAYGHADAGQRVRNRIDTKFNLASVNKMFTAVTIAQMVEEGKLGLDEAVGKYLPDYPNEKIRTGATVRHLLTHMSGLGDYFNERYYAARENLRLVKDYIPLFAEQPLLFEPGKAYEYSNAGYIVLGRLIEVISGRSYFDHVRERVFKLSGMINTDSYELDYDVPNMATGYTHAGPDGRPDFSKRRRMLYNEGVKGSPAGHGYSTVDDLFRFCRRFRTGKLVSPLMVATMTKAQAVTGTPAEQYGFGFEILPQGSSSIFGHTGGGRGGMAIVDMYEKSGYTVIVLSNYQRGGNLVAYRLRDMLANP
jgi:CubicO group peptidase (beta-lactamase class C family)